MMCMNVVFFWASAVYPLGQNVQKSIEPSQLYAITCPRKQLKRAAERLVRLLSNFLALRFLVVRNRYHQNTNYASCHSAKCVSIWCILSIF